MSTFTSRSTDDITICVLVDILLHIALNRTHWSCCHL